MKNYSGGTQVKASSLVVGDTIRDPKKQDRIMVICSIGATIFARGYEKDENNHHCWLGPDNYIIKVSSASTETTVEPKLEESL